MLGSVLLALVLGAALLATVLTTGSTEPVQRPPTHRTAAPAAPSKEAPLLAWVDYFGNLHVGNASTGAQKVVAWAKADPTTPLVSLDGRLFWVGTGCSYATISTCPYSDFVGVIPSQVKEFDPATGTTASLGRGDAVFAAGAGRSIFVERAAPRLPGHRVSGAVRSNSEQVDRDPPRRRRSPSRLPGALRLVRQRRRRLRQPHQRGRRDPRPVGPGRGHLDPVLVRAVEPGDRSHPPTRA